MEVLKHIGMPRRSGRYPWGSGENPYQSLSSFMSLVKELKDKGQSEVQIAKALNITTAQLRNRVSYSNDQQRIDNYNQALRLRDKGWSHAAIAERLKMPGESSVRSLLNPALIEKAKVTDAICDILKKEVEANKYIDVGKGVENHLGISNTKLKVALTKLQDEGYAIFTVPIKQLGTGKNTTLKVLTNKEADWKEVAQNKNDVKTISLVQPSTDYGRTFKAIEEPVPLDSKRVAVRYAEDGGANKDGVIELRPGVADISLGNAHYAQVRISVDGTHYLKGMAVYSDDLPPGVDVMFNTNKSDTGNKLDAMKSMKLSDKENPFGANIRLGEELVRAQKYYIDKDGVEKQSVLNIVNEEGNWHQWSKNLSSQMLSKQRPKFAKQQLELDYDIHKLEFDEIVKLSNPALKQYLLKQFSDGCDADAAHLKAAALPRQNTHVILPVGSLRDNEIYAPLYNNGETVVLIRHPHGGQFEIPELKVNNKNPEAKKLFTSRNELPIDAVCINPKVAQRLSGADFDGDAVIVIPNKSGLVQSRPPLKQLEEFDPIRDYPTVKGMKVMGLDKNDKLVKDGEFQPGGNTNFEMGKISNLITDMTIKGADENKIARAVKHSMVVIDAEKHKLNYVQSEKDNGIAELKKEYQNSAKGGAATIISRAKSPVYVDQRKDYPKIDPETGKYIYEYTGKTYTDRHGKVHNRQTKLTKMESVEDAFDLVSEPSGTIIENIYATHANKLKSLANEARKEMFNIQHIPYNPSARETYKNEVASLSSKLNTALKNSPVERQAQIIANARLTAIRKETPDMDKDTYKKLRNSILQSSRSRVGAKKILVNPTEKEWEAIQAGAITKTKLNEILNNADTDRIKQLSMPKYSKGMSPAKINKAQSMIQNGYTQAEVADHLGVSVSTLINALESD